MLEARLLIKLAQAQALQGVGDDGDIVLVEEAIALATDSLWEDRVSSVMPKPKSYEDKAYAEKVQKNLDRIVEELYACIADKVHRRNLQIQDLKQKLDDATRRKPVIEDLDN